MPRPRFEPTDNHFQAAYKAALNGQNETEIAKSLKISLTCFKTHKHLFKSHIKKGRDESFDDHLSEVKGSLLSLCLPFEELKTVKKNNKKGKLVIVEETRINRQPNPTSVFFFLVNKSKGEFRSINNPAVEGDSNKGEIRSWFEAARKRFEDKNKPKTTNAPAKKKKPAKKTKKAKKKAKVVKSDAIKPVNGDTNQKPQGKK